MPTAVAKIGVIVALATALPAAAQQGGEAAMWSAMSRADGRALVIAHRGASAYAPEHTFPAWDRALDMGADYLEQDLQLTRDGVLIVMHDDTLERTLRGPGCTGRVIDRTLDEIRRCSAGAWFNERYPERADPSFDDARVPTLDEVLRRYAGRARFYIETKNPAEAPGMEEKLVAVLRAHGLDGGAARDGLPVVLLQSFSAESLRRLAELAPAIPRIQLLEADPERQLIDRLAGIADYAHGIGPSRRTTGPGLIEAAHALRLRVHPYTVNDPAEMRRLLEMGADGLFSDRPDVLASVR